jgi:TonB-linked SusC/RagA family outer membrane protein
MNTTFKLFLMLMLTSSVAAFSQKDNKATIGGLVTDKYGKQLKTANVKSTFLNKDITTNRFGIFSLDGITNGDTLVVTALGYEAQEYIVKDRNKIQVKLSVVNEWNKNINMMFYSKKKLLMTGSVATIGEEDLLKNPFINLRNTVAGKLSGLFVAQSDAEPGFEDPTLLIRGTSSFSDAGGINTLVDGYERNFAELEPAEIATLNVLKDPISNALYGNRGGRKSIYVTTKRGVANQNNISVLVQNGFQSPIFMPKSLRSYDYAMLHREASANDGVPQLYTQAHLDGYKSGSDPYKYPDVDWYGAVLNKSAMQQRINLTASGGSNTARYFIMLGTTNQEGLFKYGNSNPNYRLGQSYHRYNFRSNIDVDIDKNTLVQLDVNVRLERRVQPHTDFSTTTLWRNISAYPPGLFPINNPDGSYGGTNAFQRNPVGYLKSTGYQHQDHRFAESNARVFKKLDFIAKGLRANAGFAFNTFVRPALTQKADYAVFTYNGPSLPLTKYGADLVLQPAVTFSTLRHSYVFEGGVDYDRTIAKNHVLNIRTKAYMVRQKEPGTDLPFSRRNLSAVVSYNYKEKYILDVATSYSGSDNFAEGKKNGLFPSAGASWILSKEKLLARAKWIDLLKIRGSYGEMGSDYFAGLRFPYENGKVVSGGTPAFGVTPTTVSGLSEGTLGNPDASWMIYKQTNIGLDFSFFKEVLSGSVDVFNEDVTGTPVKRVDISSIIGIAVPFTNAGISNNRGADLVLKLQKPYSKNWSAYIKTMATFTKNKIVYQSEVIRDNPWEVRTGLPIGQPFGLIAAGFFKDAAEIAASAKSSYEANLKPGDVKYVDQNKDGLIDFRDDVAIGKPFNPEVFYSAELGFKYKHFEINALFTGSESRSILLHNYEVFRSFLPASARPTDYILNNRWTPATAATATMPRLTTVANSHNYRNSTLWLTNGNFVRLKSLEIAYNLSNNALKKLGMKTGTIFVNGCNLATWSVVPEVDPEGPSAGIQNDYPMLKVVNVGFKLNL